MVRNIAETNPRHAPLSAMPEEIEVFFDGDCPLCRREIAMLRRLDGSRHIRFTDIADAEFDAGTLGVTREQLMAEINGRLPDGTWLTGVELFRRLYGAVGFQRLVAVSRLPVVTQLLNAGYRLFAKNRLRLTGRYTAAGACRVA